MAGTEELSQEELDAFRKWTATRAARKVKGTANRKAVTELKKMHKAEYDALVKKFGG